MPGAQPSHINDDFVSGDPERMIRLMLNGARELPPSRCFGCYNVMAPFDFPDDQAIADVLTYVRHAHGKGASSITAGQGRSLRGVK